ncbi:hybrid sensor histidine kinase/response regulator [Skermanella aerolata]|nr:ATP-binding protein [Skermanella aerolata]KJB91190.1 histidine kinase [Skermanella aerolata KACC 11604]
MKVFDRSLVARITASAALVATMLICVSVAMLVHLDIRQAKATLAGKADLSGQMVADAVSAAVWNLSPEEAAVALDPLRAVDDFAKAAVYGTRGELFFMMKAGAHTVPDDALLTRIIEISHPDRQGRPQKLGTLRVDFDLHPTLDAIKRNALFLVGSGLFFLVLVVWGTVYVLRGITAPIVRMTDVMSDLAAGEIDIVVPNRHRADEIGRMAHAVQTFQHNAVELRNAKECAEKAIATKARFLASASHDLRQPLQSLFLFADGLERHVVDREGSQKLLHLRRGLDVMKELLNALLDISRLDAEAEEPDIKDFPLSLLFSQIEGSYRTVAAAKGLTFSITGSELAVRSDPTLLRRILGNLIENAIQYTRAGTVCVDCRSVGPSVRIEVQDTGIGIPRNQMEDIWTEFHQVGNPERDRNKGLGLGLAIVQRLAKLLDCRVEAVSALGRGSIFSIEVPLGQTSAIARPEPAPIAGPTGGRYAVLVDDDAIVLMGLQSTLRDWGYEVLAAGSTDQALERLRTGIREPDIIVADYRLRGGRVGTEAIVKIRELFDSNIPGVLLTGETGPECAADAAMHGLSIAQKPISSRQLNVAVERLLSEASD